MIIFAIGWLILILIVMVVSTWYVVDPTRRFLIERLGKYHKTSGPGLHFKIPIVDRIAAKLFMPLNHLEIKADCKSLDNVYSFIDLTIQYQPTPGREADAYYSISGEKQQMESFVLDSVRTQIASMLFADIYSHKDAVASAAKEHVAPAMDRFGWSISNVLVTDIVPDSSVRAALQEVRTQELLRQAAEAKGEGNKILVVKNAEAEAAAKGLQGQGIANEQKAIAQGIKERLEILSEASGENAAEILKVLLLTQYFDTMKAIGSGVGSRVVFMQNEPAGLGNLTQQIAKALQTNPD